MTTPNLPSPRDVGYRAGVPGRSASAALSVVAAVALLACARNAGPGAADPASYRLASLPWPEARVVFVAELRPRYPIYFARVFDDLEPGELDLLEIRDDLERKPVDQRNYDALNAVALGYFELNDRAEALRHSGDAEYLGGSFRVARLVAVPWRAYREVESAELRDAILDFFADTASAGKPSAARTAGRIAAIVASLEKREKDPVRRERIRAIAASLAAETGGHAPF